MSEPYAPRGTHPSVPGRNEPEWEDEVIAPDLMVRGRTTLG